MNDGSRLRFEDEESTSGQLDPKSKPDKTPSGKRKRPMRTEDATTCDSGKPQSNGNPATSGQVGPKSKPSGKLRQDSEQPRPSKRLRHEDTPPPGGNTAAPDGEAAETPPNGPGPTDKKAARDGKRMNKSKLRMEKSAGKLGAARDKLAKQKPPKKPGPVKTIGRAAAFQAHRYVHKKISEVEHENVGVESAHKIEHTAEHVIRGGTRFIKKRLRTRPARQVRKWEQKNIKARADYDFRKLAQENPGMGSNPISRAWQKRRLKKQYQKQARKAAKQGAKAAKGTASGVKKVVGAIVRNPKVVLIIAAIALVLVLLMSAVSSCSVLLTDGVAKIMGTTYPSREVDLLAVEAAYAGMESGLERQIQDIPTTYPNYDEYRYNLAYIGHDPHQLAAYLSAIYQEYTLAEVQAELQRVFENQYTLTLTQTVEVRYRTETRTGSYTDSKGNSHSYTYTVQVPYNYYILNVKLENRGLDSVAQSLLTAEQKQMYDVYQQTKGNYPLLFGGGSLNGNPSEDLSGVRFVNGTRPGNPAVVDIAKSQVGNVGGQPYWSWYGFESRVEWCACFVSWCYNQAGKTEPRFAGCTSGGMGWFQSHGQWANRGYADIAPGDAIFFKWDGSNNGADHVGIVIGKDATHVYTVEGNSGDACKIRSYPLDSNVIRGYGLMNW